LEFLGFNRIQLGFVPGKFFFLAFFLLTCQTFFFFAFPFQFFVAFTLTFFFLFIEPFLTSLFLADFFAFFQPDSTLFFDHFIVIRQFLIKFFFSLFE